MKTLALAMISFFLTVPLCMAGGTPENLLSDEALLRDWRRDVYVVTIKSVDDKGATNGKPPRVRFVIDEVFRGEAKAGAELAAVWHPFPHDIDTTGRASELAAWEARPLTGPKVGDKLIVLEYMPKVKVPFSVSPRCRYAVTREKRDWVASLMGDWTTLRKKAADTGVAK